MTTFADLTSDQLAEVRDGRRMPVLLLPVGAVEPHGPHAPLGTDAIISDGMCERAVAQFADDPDIQVLVLPGLHYAVTTFASAFPGAVSLRAETLQAMVIDVCRSLADQGFPRIVVVNNHFEPAHVNALRAATAEVGAAYLDLVRRRHAARLTEEFRSGSCHAGRYETSLVLADRPETVDTEAMATLPAVQVDMVTAMADGADGFMAMGMDRAYSGAPAEATAAEGHSTFETLTELLVETIRSCGRQ